MPQTCSYCKDELTPIPEREGYGICPKTGCYGSNYRQKFYTFEDFTSDILAFEAKLKTSYGVISKFLGIIGKLRANDARFPDILAAKGYDNTAFDSLDIEMDDAIKTVSEIGDLCDTHEETLEAEARAEEKAEEEAAADTSGRRELK